MSGAPSAIDFFITYQIFFVNLKVNGNKKGNVKYFLSICLSSVEVYLYVPCEKSMKDKYMARFNNILI